MSGILYIVATPIGNLDDITFRALSVLKSVDIIAAEDTRVSSVLLNKFDIKNKLVPNHKFNEKKSADYFINELSAGKSIALISDAGTPCISDPGYILVEAAVENNIEVVGVCGACAAVTAISVCGFDCKSFAFMGFFPREKKDVEKLFKKLNGDVNVYVFYESPKRIKDTIKLFCDKLPQARICLCNDISKKFERIYRGSPFEVLNELTENPLSEKGEYTIVIEFKQVAAEEKQPLSLEALLVDEVVKNNVSLKDAVANLSKKIPNSKKEIYQASLNLKSFF